MIFDKTCSKCGSMFKLNSNHRRTMPELCKRCALVHSNRMRVWPKIDDQTLTIDRENFTAVDGSGRRVTQAHKFAINCDRCGDLYKASLGFERKKKHPWHCKGCAITVEWQDANYRKHHVDELRVAHNRPEEKKRVSEQSRARWCDHEMRQRMTNVGRDRKEAAMKGNQTRLNNILSGKSTYRARHGKHVSFNGVFLKSTYELRFANLLTKANRTWKYEPTRFVLSNMTSYCPDFYVSDLDIYVEVKGWWRDDAKEKFKLFLTEYRELRIALVTSNELKLLENEEMTLEACIVEQSWETTRF